MQNILEIRLFDSVEEAPHWSRDHADVRGAKISEAVIVNGGMVSGKPTVDFLIEDSEGGQFVAMLSGDLVINLAAAVKGVMQRG